MAASLQQQELDLVQVLKLELKQLELVQQLELNLTLVLELELGCHRKKTQLHRM